MADAAVHHPRRRILRRPTGGGDVLPATLHPVLRRVYAARGVRSAEELRLDLADLLPVSSLGGATEAAELLHREIERGGRILLAGDFDADGATSCALGVLALRAMGARDPQYLVPDRFRHGYGLTRELVGEALRHSPNLIVTVDNGTTSVAGIAAAQAAGVPVIVTDHHLPGEQLPPAAVIVNPSLPGNRFASKHLAGVGVIFYVMAALRARLREAGHPEGGGAPALTDLLDLVALGSVADLVALDANNRILIEQGLRRIRARRARPGLIALLEVGRRDPAAVTAADLGFVAGPRLNAAGRLEDMSLGVECLLAEHSTRARDLALRLDALNRERRSIEAQMRAEAEASLQQVHLVDGPGLPPGLCVYDSDWHQGVIGILAARIRERFHRPTIAFAPAKEGLLRGSARSVEALHIRDALAAVDGRNPGLIQRFGGHARAAGLTLRESDLELFRNAFEDEVRASLGSQDPEGLLHSDGPLEPQDFSLELARQLRDAGPWGQAFPEPLFDNELIVTTCRLVGEDHLKLSVRLPQTERSLDAIAFRQAERLGQLELDGGRIRAAFRLGINSYRGVETKQLVVEHLEAADSKGAD